MDDQSIEANIFKLIKAGGPIRKDDPEYGKFGEMVSRTIRLCVQMNAEANSLDDVRKRLGEIIGTEIDDSTTIFPPFYVNFGQSIRLGKNVFINHACSFLDIGRITIEDDVQIGPRVNLTSENHPLDPEDRKTLLLGSILIKRNAWIGAGATILPGVTIGDGCTIGAGSLVTKSIPPHSVAIGSPCKVVKKLA